MIELVNICKKYKKRSKETIAINNVSLSFNNNGFVSILGPSGCGKTTLLNILGGLDKQSSGTMLVNGIDTKKFSSTLWDTYRNGSIGFVFQNFNLIESMTIYDNIAMTLKLSNIKGKKQKKIVLDVLERVGLKGMEYKKPLQLSGGEQQRVAIARAIVNKPEVILADEPTGALDTKTSIEIMNILKELSKDCLIIMVTHNQELAKKYSTRIINLLDGAILSDKEYESTASQVVKKNKRVHMPLLTSMKMSLKNVLTKYIRTLITIIAGSIGITAVTLVLSVSSGVTKYMDKLQSDSSLSYPITIRSNRITNYSGNTITNRIEYPDIDNICVSYSTSEYLHPNNMPLEFVEHVEEMDKSKYSIVEYNRTLNMHLMSYTPDGLSTISDSYFTEMVDNSFMGSSYDVISGTMPKKYNEIALVVDKYNTISASVLRALGLDYTENEYKFTDIIGKEYRYIPNNAYYSYNETRGRYENSTRSKSYEEIYEQGIELVICAIIRPKLTIDLNLYSGGMVYTKTLTDFIVDNANQSDIVVDQKKYGLTKDVTTGLPYETVEGFGYKNTPEYQYENDMMDYCSVASITMITIYCDNYASRSYIMDYIKNSTAYKNMSGASYSDNMSRLADEFAMFVEILTKVLFIFALISLVVSSLMIGIVTYISVLDRTKEIGVLRSIGARKIDIAWIICTEAIIIGIIAGILGVILAYTIKEPINTIIQELIKENAPFASSIGKADLIDFIPKTLIIIVLGNSVLTLIAGLAPAIIASIKRPIDALRKE